MCMRSDVQSTNTQCNQLANVLPTVPKGVVKVTKIGNGREVEEEMFYSYWQKKYLSRYEGTMRKRIIPERPEQKQISARPHSKFANHHIEMTFECISNLTSSFT